MGALREAMDAFAPDVVLDLSDEPVLGYRERMELIAISLVRGVPYVGPDFRFEPPPPNSILGINAGFEELPATVRLALGVSTSATVKARGPSVPA